MARKTDSSKRKVLLIMTGGTIVSPLTKRGAAPDAGASLNLINTAEEYFAANGLKATSVRAFGEAGLDSSNIGPVQWMKLTSEICGAYDSLAGVLIIHGTDTMAYTAAWLSLCFPDLGIPIILTGSQLTPDQIPFDGETNLLGAARLVSCGERRWGGACIYFDWKLHEGHLAHKVHTEDIDAFRSLGECGDTYHNALRNLCPERKHSGGWTPPPELQSALTLSEADIIAAAKKVALCFAYPGGTPKLDGHEEVVVVVGFGAGNIPASYHNTVIETYPGKRKPCIIACSQTEEGPRKPCLYKDVGIGKLRGAGFRIFKQIYTFEHAIAAAHYAVTVAGEPPQSLAVHLREVK